MDQVPSEAAPPGPAFQGQQGEGGTSDVGRLLEVEVPVTVILCEKKMSLEEVRSLSAGAVVEFDKSNEALLDLVVGGKAIALGEAVIVRDKFGLRVKEIGSPRDTILKLGSSS
jgi:flagellar motor switch protein FliN/FliY